MASASTTSTSTSLICRRASTSTQGARPHRGAPRGARGLHARLPHRRRDAFTLELTCLHDRKERYDLGECEFHLAFTVKDFEAAHRLHEEMGCICYENPDMAYTSSRTRTATGWK